MPNNPNEEQKPQDPQVLPSEMMDTFVTVKVNGQEEHVSVRDAITNYQKGLGADKTFQDAAALRTQAQEPISIVEQLKAGFSGGDLNSLRGGLRKLGLPEDQIKKFLHEGKPGSKGGFVSDDNQDQDDYEEEEASGGRSRKEANQGEVVALKRMVAEMVNKMEAMEGKLKESYDEVQTTRRGRERDKYMREIKEVLESDPEIKYILNRASDRDATIDAMVDDTAGIASRRLANSQGRIQWSQNFVKDCLGDYKKKLKSLPGIPMMGQGDQLQDGEPDVGNMTLSGLADMGNMGVGISPDVEGKPRQVHLSSSNADNSHKSDSRRGSGSDDGKDGPNLFEEGAFSKSLTSKIQRLLGR